jgi:hypothetical protein
LQRSHQHFAGGFELKATSTSVQDDGSMAIDALTPKPAFFLDRVSLGPTVDSWTGRSGSPVSAALAGSVGFQISAPNRASAHANVAVCGLVDLTLSSLFNWSFVGGSSTKTIAASRA